MSKISGEYYSARDSVLFSVKKTKTKLVLKYAREENPSIAKEWQGSTVIRLTEDAYGIELKVTGLLGDPILLDHAQIQELYFALCFYQKHVPKELKKVS